jgi:pimeloyl-ACP methyl ester carboxylesterase
MSSDTTTGYDTAHGETAARHNAARIDEGAFVPIHGIDHWLTFRGDDRADPALLLLGGPGVGLSAFAPLFAAWERDFIVVQWDQPGGGATHAKNGGDRTGALTIERLVRDAIAVAEHVCDRLGKKRVVLLGASGGSILALTIASRRPDLVSACVGAGAFVDWPRQDVASYALVLARARAAHDAAAVAELERIGAPPYPDTATDAIKSKYAGAFTPSEAAAIAAMRPVLESPPADATYVAHKLVLGDPRALATAVYEKLRAEIVGFDARRLGRVFRMPMVFFQGEHDAYSVTDAVADYVAWIDAPRKLLAIVPDVGHSMVFAGSALRELLAEHVRPAALDAERAIGGNDMRP